VPFPDEPFSRRVEVLAYRQAWAGEGANLAAGLRELLPGAVRVDHIGSTAVPGLSAKDCLDVMVQVHRLDESGVASVLDARGFRRRPEPWNQQETSCGITYRKQVFGPAAGARSCNIHVRQQGGQNVRYALLFRDYLRADPRAADAWGRFKVRLASSVHDLADYGQIKAPAQEILMQAAEVWARDCGWGRGHVLDARQVSVKESTRASPDVVALAGRCDRSCGRVAVSPRGRLPAVAPESSITGSHRGGTDCEDLRVRGFHYADRAASAPRCAPRVPSRILC
jgi:GrpB-like predicted nucleotidyltransferase (UPF0157 family)